MKYKGSETQTFSMLFIDCIAVGKSILAIAKILRSSVSSLVLETGDTTVADFDTNNFGGEIGIILQRVIARECIFYFNPKNVYFTK